MIISKSTSLSFEGVAAIIRERIQQGFYPPGCCVPPQRTLAEEFGVSRRVVNIAYDRLVVERVIERTHNRRPFVPLRPGSSLEPYLLRSTGFGPRNRKPELIQTAVKTIAAVLPSHPMRPGGMAIVSGIHRVLTESGSLYRMQLYDTYQTSRAATDIMEARALAAIANLPNVEGLIWSSQGTEETIVDFLRDYPHISPIFIEYLPTCAAVDFVGVDDFESSRSAVDTLFDQGHRRVAHVVDADQHASTTDRVAGYRAAHVGRGVPVSDDLFVELDGGHDRMERSLDRLLELASPPTAVMAGSDFLAYELIAAAEDRNICVPRDLSVMGHGNIDEFTPRQFLSTVGQPFELIGRSAARRLLGRLRDRHRPEDGNQHIILQAPLVLRKSCGPPSCSAPPRQGSPNVAALASPILGR